MGLNSSAPSASEMPFTASSSFVQKLSEFRGDLFYQTATLANQTLITKRNADFREITPSSIKSLTLNSKLSRAMGSLVCLAIGDSLGCHTEFLPFSYESPRTNYRKYADIPKTAQRASIGQWTDDTSMALCLADTILEHEGEFMGADLRYRFLLWWHFGYNNGRGDQSSFGLGGNIAESFVDFHASDYKSHEMCRTEKNRNNSGNGSIMRLAPVPIYFHDREGEGLDFAKRQSYTTHTGDEAAECCRLLTHLIIRLINREPGTPFRQVFDDLKNSFKTEIKDCFSVMKLASSEKELDFEKNAFNKHENDRNWDWKAEKYVFSPTRFHQNPGYFGSYCMDAMALSLHFAYHSKSAKEAVLRAVNAAGDSDTVAAITGQIVGAVYGLEDDILELYNEEPGLKTWDNGLMVTVAYKLFFHRRKLELQAKEDLNKG